MPEAAVEAIEIAGITLTHPDRVLWPKQGVTKCALAEFYAGIADRLTHDGGAVWHVGERGFRGCEDFVDHGA